MDKFHKNISHTKCNTFPNTGDGFDYFEAINELYGMTEEKIQKYMELDFEKSVLNPKDNFEYTNNLEYNVWKSNDEIPGSSVGNTQTNDDSVGNTQTNGASVGLRIALSLPEIATDISYANFKLTLCYLSYTFMIDIDLPKLRKSWYEDCDYTKVRNISRVFEHNLVNQAKDQLEAEFNTTSDSRLGEQNLSLTEMKTVKGVHVVGCLDNVKYPLNNIKLLEILKKYTDPAYMIKSLKDPSRGFCDKIAEVHTVEGFGPWANPDDPQWNTTKHLKQAQRIGLEFMNNRTPANRIALFRRVLAENLDFYNDTDPDIVRDLEIIWFHEFGGGVPGIQALRGVPGPGYSDAKNRIRVAKNTASRKLAIILQACISNTENTGPTKYSIDNNILQYNQYSIDNIEECEAYFIQTNGCGNNCNMGSRTNYNRNIEERILDGGSRNIADKFNTRYQVPKKFENFEVITKPRNPQLNISNDIFDLFTKLVNDCWNYSSNPAGNHIFNNELKTILNNPRYNDIKIENFSFSNEDQRNLTREETNYDNNKYKYNDVCKSLSKPSTYRPIIAWRTEDEIDRIASLTKKVKNKIGIGGIRGSLAELAAAQIPNDQLLDPPPDRLNLTDDAGPSIYQEYRNGHKTDIRIREGIEITEAI